MRGVELCLVALSWVRVECVKEFASEIFDTSQLITKKPDVSDMHPLLRFFRENPVVLHYLQPKHWSPSMCCVWLLPCHRLIDNWVGIRHFVMQAAQISAPSCCTWPGIHSWTRSHVLHPTASTSSTRKLRCGRDKSNLSSKERRD